MSKSGEIYYSKFSLNITSNEIKHEVPFHSTAWLNLLGIVLRRLTQKKKHYMITLMKFKNEQN